MIIEKRTYRLKPGAAHEFLKAYQEEGFAIQGPALGNLLGFFVSEIGELNRVIQFWGFESFEDRSKRRAELSSKSEWRAFLQNAGHMVLHQETELLAPTAFSPIK